MSTARAREIDMNASIMWKPIWPKAATLKHDSVIERVANVVLYVGKIGAAIAFIVGFFTVFNEVTAGTYRVAYWGYWLAMLFAGCVYWLLVAGVTRTVFYVMTGR